MKNKLTIAVISHGRPQGLVKAAESAIATGAAVLVYATGADDATMGHGLDRCMAIGCDVIRREDDPGNNAAWLAAVKAAKNCWVLLLHDDDWLDAELFRRYWPEIDAAMTLGDGFVGWDQERITETGEARPVCGLPAAMGENPTDALLRYLANDSLPPRLSMGIHRREHLIETFSEFSGWMDEKPGGFAAKGSGGNMVYGNDLLVWLRACERYLYWRKIGVPVVKFSGIERFSESKEDGYAAAKEIFRHRPLSASKPDFSQITPVIVECMDPDGAADVLRYLSGVGNWGGLRLIAPKRPSSGFGGDFIQIPYFLYIGYSTFSCKCLNRYIDTPYAMMVQKDGFPVRPWLWCRSWLEWDYLGAPWPIGWMRDEYRVGNSGCNLRSARFLKECAECGIDHNNERDHTDCKSGQDGGSNDDVWLCQRDDVRAHMSKAGIRYAPVEVAKFFSVECDLVTERRWEKEGDCFGFHGFQYTQTRQVYKELLKRGKDQATP